MPGLPPGSSGSKPAMKTKQVKFLTSLHKDNDRKWCEEPKMVFQQKAKILFI